VVVVVVDVDVGAISNVAAGAVGGAAAPTTVVAGFTSGSVISLSSPPARSVALVETCRSVASESCPDDVSSITIPVATSAPATTTAPITSGFADRRGDAAAPGTIGATAAPQFVQNVTSGRRTASHAGQRDIGSINVPSA
jgi:hypothetical protein